MASPVRLLALLMASVFAIEALTMGVLHALPPMPLWQENLLDAINLTVLLFPILYFFVFRPMQERGMQQTLMQQKLAQQLDELQRIHKILILRELRMKELYDENQALKTHIQEADK